ncbi:MAG: tRNA 2-thiouridine(34) synthase MnmA [Angustibacter sp.]
MRVLAAMSGGVDSAVAAARAVRAGHEVVGVHLALSSAPSGQPVVARAGARGCCTVEDAHDARRSADVLGIPFYVWDFSEQFQAGVEADFVAEYEAGRTPNPCLRCNERIKFSALLDRALALGFDTVCTGHYARIVLDGDERQLHRAVDEAKDQSYVLGVLTAEQLSRAMFPLGESTKTVVRAEAVDLGLAVADKPDSHDVCFIPDGDTQGWLGRRLGRRPGPITDRDGTVLGEHDGTHGFTVGQRRGLRIARPASDGRPRYVLEVRPVTRTVVVGSVSDLDVGLVLGEPVRWCTTPPAGTVQVLAQVRAHGEAVAASAEVVAGSGGRAQLRVALGRPIRGVAPGQAVVLYDGTRVLGSATIVAAEPIPGQPPQVAAAGPAQ